ncbi:TPA: NCS2 family permease, partial [Legionella pneumophila]
VQGIGVDWQHALAMVFISGLLFLFLTLTKLRRLLIEAIPHNLQIAIVIGISLLIALIALENNQIIIDDQHNLMRLGPIIRPESGLFFLGFILMLFLFPLAKMIPSFAVGPALLYVACCMIKHITNMKLQDISETAPCMVIIMMVPFTASIADGIGLGIILYTLLKLFTRQKPNPLIIVLSLVFIVFFLIN